MYFLFLRYYTSDYSSDWRAIGASSSRGKRFKFSPCGNRESCSVIICGAFITAEMCRWDLARSRKSCLTIYRESELGCVYQMRKSRRRRRRACYPRRVRALRCVAYANDVCPMGFWRPILERPPKKVEPSTPSCTTAHIREIAASQEGKIAHERGMVSRAPTSAAEIIRDVSR